MKKDWSKIKSHVRQSFKTSLSVSIATVDKNGHPNVTPIGSLFLNDEQSGFYFEKFPSSLPEDVKANNQCCILAVNSGKRFWLKSLYQGKFSSYPAIRLYGTLGDKREATPSEIHALNRRMRNTRILKGHQYLWTDMKYIREVHFSKAESVRIGKMTQGL